MVLPVLALLEDPHDSSCSSEISSLQSWMQMKPGNYWRWDFFVTVYPEKMFLKIANTKVLFYNSHKRVYEYCFLFAECVVPEIIHI